MLDDGLPAAVGGSKAYPVALSGLIRTWASAIMNYCSHCAGSISLAVPPDDDRPRHVCGDCGTVHYQNPKLIAGCIAEWEDQILLCRRAIEPRRGYWTLPAGYMENGETIAEAAAREALEEANARVEIGPPFTLLSIPHISQVYMLFRARLMDLNIGPGLETLEVRMCVEDQIPWDDIAFPSILKTLQLYYQDRRRGEFQTHADVIHKRRRGHMERRS